MERTLNGLLASGDPIGRRIAERLVPHPGLAGDPALGPCLLWPGAVNGRRGDQVGGYGSIRIAGRARVVHVVVHEIVTGQPVPEGMEHDHICHDPLKCTVPADCPHRACASVDHIEIVPVAVNRLRSLSPAALHAQQTECEHGHPFTAENVYVPPKRPNRRECRQCRATRSARWAHPVVDGQEPLFDV